MSSHANPSRDPANDDSLLGFANEILQKFLQRVDDMLPARVISYDRTTNRVQVVPLVRVITTAGQQIGRAQIASVPVLQLGGGGFTLNFPLKRGDLGWIKANDRDISLVLQSYAENAPNSKRMHSFEDCVFIPDVMTGTTIQGEDTDNAVLQTLDGSVRVALWADRLKLTAGAFSVTIGPASIHLDAGAASYTLTSAGHVFAGPVTMPDGATIASIPFTSHKHTGVTTGGSNTGGPTS